MRKSAVEDLAPATPEHVPSSQSSTLDATDSEDLVVLESSPGRPGSSKAVRLSQSAGSGIARLSSFYFNGARPPAKLATNRQQPNGNRTGDHTPVSETAGDLGRMALSRQTSKRSSSALRSASPATSTSAADFGEMVSRFEWQQPSDDELASSSRVSRKRTADEVASSDDDRRKRATPDSVVVDSSDESSSDGRPVARGSRRGRLLRGSRPRPAPADSPKMKPRRTLTRRPRPPSPEEEEEEEEKHGTISVGSSDEDSAAEGLLFDRSFDSIEPHVLQLFNHGTSEELVEKTRATVAEANAVIAMRPFEDVDAVEQALRKARNVRLALFNHYRDTLLGHAEVENVIGRCAGTYAQLKRAMQRAGVRNSTNSSRAEGAGENTELIQPRMISKDFQLKHYQLEGVEWLTCLRNADASGILADEMGLGKTFQVIAFLCRGIEDGRVRGPSLVVCPSSTLDNWMNECAKFAPSLRAVAYSGSQPERLAMQQELQDESSYDVLITTYNLATGNKLDRVFLKKRNFRSMILDEGHMVKNCMSSRYKWLMQMRARFRLLLTGTPLQNNLQELVSLLTFIMPQVFAQSLPALTHAFKSKAPASSSSARRAPGTDSDDAVTSSVAASGAQTPADSEAAASVDAQTPADTGAVGAVDAQHIEQAKTLLRPFVLRRRKCDVLGDLPKKIENIVNVELTAAQRQIYDSVAPAAGNDEIRACLQNMDKDDQNGAKNAKPKQPAASWIATFMELRKAADHPLLLRSHYKPPQLEKMARQLLREPDYADANYTYVLEDMEVCSDFELHKLCSNHPKMHKFCLPDEALLDSGKVQQLRIIIDECVERGEKLLLFSQFTSMLDILEAVLGIWKTAYFRLDGQTKVDERQGMIDIFNSKSSSVPVFLLSTKAGGFGINLTSANVVVIYDAGNNPSEERQAEDRAHRVGQTKDVRVYKLVATNTIDETILESSKSKLLVEQMFWF
ncbi:DNA-dependent ATPase fun30 [Coemansia guatemalensis]|uniref:DNA-dependent ATPase fun30 n=1 Tax=Coemansia guatemalensis TaxID=2761395 RepID=A0A9W8I1X8_9FUNG|nr:DNA-dependent ATPase fun30 [Coemansia guatemalensis]